MKRRITVKKIRKTKTTQKDKMMTMRIRMKILRLKKILMKTN